jgi:hypothetical protein
MENIITYTARLSRLRYVKTNTQMNHRSNFLHS